MRIDIITCIPELLTGPFGHSIVKRAIDKELAEIHIHNLREFATDKHRSVDDYAFGGGAGMVLMPGPVVACIEHLTKGRRYDEIIYMSPDGAPFVQNTANELSLKQNIILLCGHYKGLDERVRQHFITREISIGDYVISGGELAAAVVADAVIRLLPGVLSDETSALSDSFQNDLVAPPVYTRPADFRGFKVPEVLLSGHAAKIEAWRHQQSLDRTSQRRPGLMTD
ncbi:MAG: tRNA (guanosine(37)-N1)-methyltransferase TrmD [Cyclobacteriaceae bacterium]